MPLSTEQVKSVEKILRETYQEVTFDGKKKMVVFVDNPDRAYRKKILQAIQKEFKAAPWKATYTEPSSGGKTGAVKMAPIQIEVKPNAKAKPISTGKAKFKPSDITPSIVNDWLSPEEMVKNVEQYIKSVDLESQVEKEILHLLKETAKDTSTAIPFDAPKDLVPAEFFEVLTAVKLAVLLRSNDTKIRNVLGIPKKMDLSKSKIKIYIPQKANFPLIDYYISVTATEKKDEDSALKISVKSKVKSPKANTVKFKDVFEKERDVDNWYKGLNRTLQKEQIGPRTVAESALGVYGGYSGKSLFGVPIFSMLNLLKEDKANITKLIRTEIGEYVTAIQFESILKEITKQAKSISNNTELSDVLKGENLKSAIKLIQGSMSKAGGKEVKNNVYNLAYVCERLLVTSSKKDSVTKYNYYQMFFDEVLTKKKIAYAVSSLKGKQLHYNFYSMVNFTQEYASWLELRSKNSPNQPNDVIGIDV